MSDPQKRGDLLPLARKTLSVLYRPDGWTDEFGVEGALYIAAGDKARWPDPYEPIQRLFGLFCELNPDDINPIPDSPIYRLSLNREDGIRGMYRVCHWLEADREADLEASYKQLKATDRPEGIL